jgi:branched-chain amino acid transport system ATP-binding protein
MVKESLVVKNLHAWYGGSHALQGVSLSLKLGTMAAVIGRNGAGKSTFLKAIMGLVAKRQGSVMLGGNQVGHLSPSQRAKLGLAYIPERRGIFPSLTVLENLMVSARAQLGAWNLERVFTRFPRLQERQYHGGATLSGGEQQMLSVARALMTNGRVLLLDEPTEGLAPNIVAEMVHLFEELLVEGFSIVLVEQNIAFIEKMADEIFVLGKGKVQWSGPTSTFNRNDEVIYHWLGL